MEDANKQLSCVGLFILAFVNLKAIFNSDVKEYVNAVWLKNVLFKHVIFAFQ